MIDSTPYGSIHVPPIFYKSIDVQQANMTLTIWTLAWTDADVVTVVYPQQEQSHERDC